MKISNLPSAIILFSVIISMSSCGFFVKKKALAKTTVESGAIPENFGSNNTVLVCLLTEEKFRDKFMKKHFEKNYNGSLVYLTPAELKSEEYENLDKYRYVFSGSIKNHTIHKFQPEDADIVRFSRYNITDRKKDSVYPGKVSSSYFGKILKAYSINLEKVRSSNQKI